MAQEMNKLEESVIWVCITQSSFKLNSFSEKKVL